MLRKVKPLRMYDMITSQWRHGLAYSEKWSNGGHEKCPILADGQWPMPWRNRRTIVKLALQNYEKFARRASFWGFFLRNFHVWGWLGRTHRTDGSNASLMAWGQECSETRHGNFHCKPRNRSSGGYRTFYMLIGLLWAFAWLGRGFRHARYRLAVFPQICIPVALSPYSHVGV